MRVHVHVHVDGEKAMWADYLGEGGGWKFIVVSHYISYAPVRACESLIYIPLRRSRLLVTSTASLRIDIYVSAATTGCSSHVTH